MFFDTKMIRECSKMCENTKAVQTPRKKKYGSIDFTLTYTKCGKEKKRVDEQINYSKL